MKIVMAESTYLHTHVTTKSLLLIWNCSFSG